MRVMASLHVKVNRESGGDDGFTASFSDATSRSQIASRQ
jgi:hypothetical protein